jgi:hypothetical protein
MPTLFVRCVVCRSGFPTPLALPLATDGGLLVSGLALKCPRCGAERRYYTKDFRVPRVSPESRKAPTSSGHRKSKASESTPLEWSSNLATGPRQWVGATVLTAEGARPPPRKKRTTVS